MTISEKIAQQIAAAEALGAPLFSLDVLHVGAVAAEQASTNLKAAQPTDAYGFVASVDNGHDANLKIIKNAAEAAFAFACCRHLPPELGEYRERDDANRLIISGIEAAKQYL